MSYNIRNHNKSNNRPPQKTKDESFFNKVEQGYALEAEKKMRNLFSQSNRVVTTSQIRNILSLINEISSMVSRIGNKKLLTDDIKNHIQYLLVKIYYQCGKEQDVKQFVDETKIIELLLCVEDSKQSWELFSRYVEALVAFHKYLGGKD